MRGAFNKTHPNATRTYLRENLAHTSAYLAPAAVLKSASLLVAANASAAAAGAPALQRGHVAAAMLPTLYVVLLRFDEIAAYAAAQPAGSPYAWPGGLPDSKGGAFALFAELYAAEGVTQLDEGGDKTLAWLKKQVLG